MIKSYFTLCIFVIVLIFEYNYLNTNFTYFSYRIMIYNKLAIILLSINCFAASQALLKDDEITTVEYNQQDDQKLAAKSIIHRSRNYRFFPRKIINSFLRPTHNLQGPILIGSSSHREDNSIPSFYKDDNSNFPSHRDEDSNPPSHRDENSIPASHRDENSIPPDFKKYAEGIDIIYSSRQNEELKKRQSKEDNGEDTSLFKFGGTVGIINVLDGIPLNVQDSDLEKLEDTDKIIVFAQLAKDYIRGKRGRDSFHLPLGEIQGNKFPILEKTAILDVLDSLLLLNSMNRDKDLNKIKNPYDTSHEYLRNYLDITGDSNKYNKILSQMGDLLSEEKYNVYKDVIKHHAELNAATDRVISYDQEGNIIVTKVYNTDPVSLSMTMHHHSAADKLQNQIIFNKIFDNFFKLYEYKDYQFDRINNTPEILLRKGNEFNNLQTNNDHNNCQHLCTLDGENVYCCDNKRKKLKVSLGLIKQGICPIHTFPYCNRADNVAFHSVCQADYDCIGGKKCCFDNCLKAKICKQPFIS